MIRIMKKTIALLLCGSCLVGLNSCFKQEENLWNETAQQRVQTTINNYTDILTSAQDGWVLEYFANESEQGYAFLMKFNKNMDVTIAAKNSVSSSNAYKEELSTYGFVDDQGPVLSFNTYNSLFTVFAEPGSDGYGHQGDYEFVVDRVSANNDTVYLKGKKWGLNARLVKFPMGQSYTAADGSSAKIEKWEDYFTATEAVKSRLFNTNVSKMYMSVGDHKYEISVNNGVLSFLPVNASITTLEAVKSYMVSIDDTFELSSPYTGESGEISVDKFRVSSNGESIESVGGEYNAVITAPSASEMIMSQSLQWVVMPESWTGGFKTRYEALKKQVTDGFASLGYPGVQFRYYLIRFNSSFGTYALLQNTGMGDGMHGLNIEATGDNSLKINSTGVSDRNAANDKKNFPLTVDFLEYLAGKEYTITPTSVLTPVEIKFVSKDDSNDSFVVKCQSVGARPSDLIN